MIQSQVNALLAILKAAYPNSAPTLATAQVYETMLADVPFAEAEQAVYEHIATSNWFPTVSELRGRIARERVSAPSEPEAYRIVCDLANKRDHDEVRGRLEALHPLVREALASSGGIWSLRNSEALRWRMSFRKTYEQLVADAQVEANLQPLRGLLMAPAGVPLLEDE